MWTASRGEGPAKFWSIVLAGGRGERMLDWIEACQGERRPKQFCTFTGSRSMLEHTLARAAGIVPRRNILTVIQRSQRGLLEETLGGVPTGRVIEQPEDRGTAAGVLLPATYVMAQDPEAVVLILPSDHFIHPEPRFRRLAHAACRLAGGLPDCFVLLGAPAEGPETDYGWILAESDGEGAVDLADGRPRPVLRFREKPEPWEAEALYGTGALWNTLVVAVRVQRLWKLAWSVLPRTMARFETLRCVIRSVQTGRSPAGLEEQMLTDLYADMETADFSRTLLQSAVGCTVVVPMQGVEWSDWGRPDRVQASLARIGGRRASLHRAQRAAVPAHVSSVAAEAPPNLL